MAAVPVYQPAVVGTIAGDTRPIGVVNMTLVAGGVSTCNVSLYEQNDAAGEGGSAVNALATDTASNLAALQTAMFQQKAAADSEITIFDGKGNTLSFRGFASNPTYNNALGGLGLSHVLMHESVMLSAYRSFIYPSPNIQAREKDNLNGPDGAPLSSTEMTTRFMEVLDILIKKWSLNKNLGEPAFSQLQREARHAQNLLIYPRLKQVMASTGGASWPEIDKVQANNNGNQNTKVSHYISDILSETNGDFFNVLGYFEQSFQCMFVPDFPVDASSFGHFVSWASIGTGDGVDLTLPITTLQFSGGTRGYLPLTHALISGSVTDAWRANLGLGQTNINTPLVVVYPDNPNLAGLGVNNSGPPWLNGLTEGDVDKSRALGLNQLDLALYKSGRLKINDFTGDIINGLLKPILVKWAQNTYYFTALESASCSVQIPLDVSIKPGMRYNVKNMNGKIFSGFLAQVIHRAEVRPRQGTALTDLTFTHVTAGNFKLPE